MPVERGISDDHLSKLFFEDFLGTAIGRENNQRYPGPGQSRSTRR